MYFLCVDRRERRGRKSDVSEGREGPVRNWTTQWNNYLVMLHVWYGTRYSVFSVRLHAWISDKLPPLQRQKGTLVQLEEFLSTSDLEFPICILVPEFCKWPLTPDSCYYRDKVFTITIKCEICCVQEVKIYTPETIATEFSRISLLGRPFTQFPSTHVPPLPHTWGLSSIPYIVKMSQWGG